MQLPPTWRAARLEELQSAEPRAITDGPFGSHLTSAHYTEHGPRVVRLQNIGDGYFVDAKAHISESHFQSLRQHEVKSGDLLVASLGEVLPRACLAPTGLGPAIVKADCIRVRLADDVDSRWVLYALQRPAVRRWADEHRHGVGRPRLGLKVIRDIPIPLPNLQEQRRIVEILDDHLSRLHAANNYASSAATQMDQVVASVLAHDSDVKSAPALPLKDLLDRPLANGRSVPTREGGFPVLRLTALEDGNINLDQRKDGAWTEVEARPFLVNRGDFFVSRGNGSLRLVARGGLVCEDPGMVAFPDTLIRIRLNEQVCDSRYLAVLWNSPLVRRQIEAAARTTAGIYKVNQRQLEAVVLPVPSLAAQKTVLSRATEASEAVKQLRKRCTDALTRAESLRRALFEAAFTGTLTGSRSDLDRVEEMAGV